ncbi:MAG: hypothetical protein ACJA1Z_000014 [Patiriisocius sp.]|jgi:hypothetical protein
MILYAVASLIALWKYKYYKDTALKYFIVFLFFALFIEWMGLYIGKKYGSNALLYNIYYLFYFFYIIYLFKEAVHFSKFKKYISICLCFFFVVYIYSMFTIDFTKKITTWSYVTGGLFSIIAIVFYYLDLLKSDRVITIKSNTLFWISLGFLLFFVGYIPIKIIKNGIYNLQLIQSYNLLHRTLIIIMNLCFIVGFLIAKPKLSQSQL